ncbi:ribose-phosphate pyrophosphokinase [bacterium]|nr:ribose-phosphate pyrophosphokinase [bacterium]
MKIFAGNANIKLAANIARALNKPLGKIDVNHFPEGEISVQVRENVRGADVFVIQPSCPPPNENLMELLIMMDALRRASARRITAVLPFFGYARQDRKDQPRVPITAKLVANLITTAGADRVLTMDLHADQIQGFFDIPVDNLQAAPVMIEYFRGKNIRQLVVVTPDVGGIKLARRYADQLRCPLAIVDKRRTGPTEATAMNVIGEVAGKQVLIVDDMIATGKSLVEAVKIIRRLGARDIYVCCSHPVFSGSAAEIIRDSDIKEVLMTDSIPFRHPELNRKVKVCSVAPLFAEAIRRIYNETSVSTLFSFKHKNRVKKKTPAA